MANGIKILNYRSLSRHAPGKKPSLQAMKPAIFTLHFHDIKKVNGFVTERDIIIYRYNMIDGSWIPGHSFMGGCGLGTRLVLKV